MSVRARRLGLNAVQLLALPMLAAYVFVMALPRLRARTAPALPRRVVHLTPYGAGTRSGTARAIRDMFEMLTLMSEVRVVLLRDLRPSPGWFGRLVGQVLGLAMPMEEYLQPHIADPKPVLSQIAGADLVLIEFVYGALFLFSAPRVSSPLVLRDHEVLARRYAADIAAASHLFDKATLAIRLGIVWLLTFHLYLSADRIVALTPEDAGWLRKWFPFIGPRVVAIPVSFATDPLPPVNRTARSRDLLYAANFFHQPNVDGLVWFLAHCAPFIDDNVTLHLVGVDTPLNSITLPETRLTVVRHGHVEDFDTDFADVRVALAPIISGGGIRVKNLLFGSFGKAIVTTHLGNEGIEFRNGTDAMVCGTAKEFAEAVNLLVQNPDQAVRLGQNARALIEHKFSHETILARYRTEVFAS